MLPASKSFCSKALAVCCIPFQVDYYILPSDPNTLNLQYVVSNPLYGYFKHSFTTMQNQVFETFETSLGEKLFVESYLDSFLIQFLTIIIETTVLPKFRSIVEC